MGGKKNNDGISQRTEDAIVNLIASRLTEKTATSGRTIYAEVMDAMSEPERELVERSLDRHAARRRAAGEPGW